MRFSTTAEPMPCAASPMAAVLPETLRFGQQPVAGGRARNGPPGQGVADGQCPHVDADDAEPFRCARREHGVGELGVGDQRSHLEQGGQDEPEEVELGQLVELATGAGQLGQQHVLAHEEGQQHGDGHLEVAGEIGAPRPPRWGWRRRHLRGFLVGSPWLGVVGRRHPRSHACTWRPRRTASSGSRAAKLDGMTAEGQDTWRSRIDGERGEPRASPSRRSWQPWSR